MARDDDGDGVLAVGETDGAGGVLVTEEFRERAVARGRAVGDLPQGIPHPVFERRADSFERQGECGAGAGEVFLELLSCAREHFGRRALLRFHPAGLVRRRGTAARRREVHAGEGGLGGREDELANRRLEAGGRSTRISWLYH